VDPAIALKVVIEIGSEAVRVPLTSDVVGTGRGGV